MASAVGWDTWLEYKVEGKHDTRHPDSTREVSVAIRRCAMADKYQQKPDLDSLASVIPRALKNESGHYRTAATEGPSERQGVDKSRLAGRRDIGRNIGK